MALLNKTELGLKETGQTATIPNDPRAQLMYYLDCICHVLNFDDDNVNRLRNYGTYHTLTREDEEVLIGLCVLLKPDFLVDKCIFQNDELCGEKNNQFFELQKVEHKLLVVGSVLIGGHDRQVINIMTFKKHWLEVNWKTPINKLIDKHKREDEAEQLERERQERERQAEQQRAQQERERQERERRAEQQRAQQERERQERERRAEQQRAQQERERQERERRAEQQRAQQERERQNREREYAEAQARTRRAEARERNAWNEVRQAQRERDAAMVELERQRQAKKSSTCVIL